MNDAPRGKRVSEDWSLYNEAVRRRAAGMPPGATGSRPPPRTAGPGGMGGMGSPGSLGGIPPRGPYGAGPSGLAPYGASPGGIAPNGLPATPAMTGWPWTRGAWGYVRRGHPVLRVLFGVLLILAILAALGSRAPHHDDPSTPQATPDLASATPPPPAPPAAPAPASPPAEPTGAPVVVDYTQFHSVEVLGGHVVTGWHYAHSGDPAPSFQYCYYDRPDTGNAVLPDGTRVTRVLLGPGRAAPADSGGGVANVRYDIADRPGTGPAPMPAALAADLGPAGWQEAATHCQWFGQ